MKKLLIIVMCVLLLALAACASPGGRDREEDAGATLTGVVRDASAGIPLEGVSVRCAGDGGTLLEAETNAQGRFRLRDVPPGDYVVTVETAGVAPEELELHVYKSDDTVDLGEITLDAADRGAAAEERAVPSCGYAVETPEGLVYWRYSAESFTKLATFGSFTPDPETRNQLVLRGKTGEETVLLEDNGSGKLCYANGRIYFSVWNAELNQLSSLRSVAPDGTDARDCGLMRAPLGLSADGRWLVGNGSGGGVILLDTQTGESREIIGSLTLLALRGNTVLYAVFDADQATLFAQDTDGSEPRSLMTVRYDFVSNTGGHIIGETRFPTVGGVDYIYFSYGEIAGTGVFWQGGKIARARLDGGGGEILAGEDELVAPDFTVNPDGSVTAFSAGEGRIPEGMYSGGTEYLTEDGAILWFLAEDGSLAPLFEKEDYAAFSALNAGAVTGEEYLRVAEAGRTGDRAYLRLERCVEDDSASLGWRTGYRRAEGAVFLKELGTGETVLLFRY